MSAATLKSKLLFDSETCLLLQAVDSERNLLVGHAFVCRFVLPNLGEVSWITQLVVHSDYRRRGVAKKLCRMAWGVGRYFASGLVSANPYAVRALEAATERRCDRGCGARHARALVEHSRIPYVQNCELEFDDGKCLIDTKFFVDHTEVSSVLSKDAAWKLGPLQEGKEYFAFTFAASPRTS